MSLRARVLAGTLVIAVLLVAAAVAISGIIQARLIERVDDQLDARAMEFEQCGLTASMDGEPPTGPPPEDLPLPAEGGTTRTQVCGGIVSQQTVAPDGDGSTPGADDDATFPQSQTTQGPTDEGVSTDVTTPDPPKNEATISGQAGPMYSPLSVFWVGHLTNDGVVPDNLPGTISVEGDAATGPDIDSADIVAALESGDPFIAGSKGSDTRWRVRAVQNEEEGEVIVVAQTLDDVDAILDRLVWIEVVATGAILAALGLVAWWVDRHGIRPVKQMTTTATAIAAGDLSQRVPETDANANTEAGRLGTALNTMLGRIEEAFDERSRSESRLRQFVADASHELRTPVTTIRGYSELYESGGLDDRRELSEAMRRTRQETLRMGSLVDDLLLLARLDQGPELVRAPVDLAAIVDDAGRDAQAVDPDRVVTTGSDGPVVVMADADRLRQVLANLVGNALVHTPSSAPIDIHAHHEGDRAVVEVVDHGPGMSTEAANRAFERFFRADPSRSRHRGGSGLGLAIVQASVTAHGGEVCLDSTLGRGTTVRVILPLASTF